MQSFEKLCTINGTSNPGAKDTVPDVTAEVAKLEV